MGWLVNDTPAGLPPGKRPYPLYRWPVFDPRTVQAVVSRYTEWAICGTDL